MLVLNVQIIRAELLRASAQADQNDYVEAIKRNFEYIKQLLQANIIFQVQDGKISLDKTDRFIDFEHIAKTTSPDEAKDKVLRLDNIGDPKRDKILFFLEWVILPAKLNENQKLILPIMPVTEFMEILKVVEDAKESLKNDMHIEHINGSLVANNQSQLVSIDYITDNPQLERFFQGLSPVIWEKILDKGRINAVDLRPHLNAIILPPKDGKFRVVSEAAWNSLIKEKMSRLTVKLSEFEKLMNDNGLLSLTCDVIDDHITTLGGNLDSLNNFNQQANQLITEIKKIRNELYFELGLTTAQLKPIDSINLEQIVSEHLYSVSRCIVAAPIILVPTLAALPQGLSLFGGLAGAGFYTIRYIAGQVDGKDEKWSWTKLIGHGLFGAALGPILKTPSLLRTLLAGGFSVVGTMSTINEFSNGNIASGVVSTILTVASIQNFNSSLKITPSKTPTIESIPVPTPSGRSFPIPKIFSHPSSGKNTCFRPTQTAPNQSQSSTGYQTSAPAKIQSAPPAALATNGAPLGTSSSGTVSFAVIPSGISNIAGTFVGSPQPVPSPAPSSLILAAPAQPIYAAPGTQVSDSSTVPELICILSGEPCLDGKPISTSANFDKWCAQQGPEGCNRSWYEFRDGYYRRKTIVITGGGSSSSSGSSTNTSANPAFIPPAVENEVCETCSNEVNEALNNALNKLQGITPNAAATANYQHQNQRRMDYLLTWLEVNKSLFNQNGEYEQIVEWVKIMSNHDAIYKAFMNQDGIINDFRRFMKENSNTQINSKFEEKNKTKPGLDKHAKSQFEKAMVVYFTEWAKLNGYDPRYILPNDSFHKEMAISMNGLPTMPVIDAVDDTLCVGGHGLFSHALQIVLVTKLASLAGTSSFNPKYLMKLYSEGKTSRDGYIFNKSILSQFINQAGDYRMSLGTPYETEKRMLKEALIADKSASAPIDGIVRQKLDTLWGIIMDSFITGTATSHTGPSIINAPSAAKFLCPFEQIFKELNKDAGSPTSDSSFKSLINPKPVPQTSPSSPIIPSTGQTSTPVGTGAPNLDGRTGSTGLVIPSGNPGLNSGSADDYITVPTSTNVAVPDDATSAISVPYYLSPSVNQDSYNLDLILLPVLTDVPEYSIIPEPELAPESEINLDPEMDPEFVPESSPDPMIPTESKIVPLQ